MKLIINGKETDLTEGMTISQLLIDQEVKMPEMVSVELNGQILKRGEFESTTLNQDDKVEFLYFMGGGNVIN
jgi:sulfur carrier protein